MQQPYPYDPSHPNYSPTVPLGGHPASSTPYPPYPPYQYPYQSGVYTAQPSAAPRPAAKPPTPPRMPKAEAMALTQRLKRGTIWMALLGFLALAGLAGAHAVGVTSAAASQGTTGTSGSDTNGQQPSTQQNNPFFGSQPSSGPFGSSGSGSQAPVTGTGVS